MIIGLSCNFTSKKVLNCQKYEISAHLCNSCFTLQHAPYGYNALHELKDRFIH